ncbi:MAG: N-formylglutamate amidohydrolase [Gammaproteobacteria bacterium]
MSDRLLGAHEPAPVTVARPEGRSPAFLTCDHASNRIPEALGTLGLDAVQRARHIAWDIGAAGVSQHLSAMLDATLVLQNYSRLVIDCNRPHDDDSLIPRVSEATEIPGNHDLDECSRAQRRDEIFHPYHEAIGRLLDARRERPTVLVAIHSFTPVYLEQTRPWHIGVLYGKDTRIANHLIYHFDAHDSVIVGDNEPYRIDDKDFGIPVHGEARGIPHVLVEIRQDLIEHPPGQQVWAEHLLEPLNKAISAVFSAAPPVLL